MENYATGIFEAMTIRIPSNYGWKPKEDITVHELALCLPMFHAVDGHNREAIYDTLPDNAKRHFLPIGQEGSDK